MKRTRARSARTVSTSTPRECLCEHGPALVATFRHERLVAVAREHWRGCPMPSVELDPHQWAHPGLIGSQS